MKLGFNTQTCFLETMPRKIEAVAAAGFEAIELWTSEIEGFVREGGSLPRLRRMLADAGLLCFSAIKVEGWFENDGDLMGVQNDHQSIMRECRRRMEICAELGIPYIIACPSYSHRGRPMPPFGQGVEYFQEMMAMGKSVGVTPTIEFLGQSHQINHLDICVEFLNAVKDPAARMVVDAYHLWRGPGCVEDFARARRDQISLLHVNDASPSIERDRHRDRDRLMPGDGCIDLVRFFAIAREIGFDGVVSLGVYNRSLWGRDIFEVCREGYEKTKRFLTQPCPDR